MRKKITSVTVEQIQKLDKLAIEEYGVPSLTLMENAGRKVADEVIKRLQKAEKSHVCVICGLGNNAGDGFVVSRHLIDAGIKTSVFLIGKGNQLKHDAAVNYEILGKTKRSIREVEDEDPCFIQDVQGADIVVDAIFGVGLNREICDPFRLVIDLINKSGKEIIAVDIPSGLDGTTGGVYGICIKADATVTFTFPKKGFSEGQGPQYTGQVIVVDIGIPAQLI